jgi:hypothetical protein
MRSPEIVAYAPSYQSQLEAFFREVWQQSRFPFDPEGAHSDLRNIPTQYQVKRRRLLAHVSIRPDRRYGGDRPFGRRCRGSEAP